MTFHVTVDGTEHGPAGTAIVQKLSAGSSGYNRIGRATVGLTFPASAGYSFINKREVQIWETGATANALFGGFIASIKRSRVKGTNQKWVTLTCEDYNKLLDTIRTDANEASAFTVAAGTFAAQVASVVLTMQKNGDTVVQKTINTALYVNNLTGAHTLPSFQVKGMSLRQALQVIMNNAQIDTSALRPRFSLQLMDDGAAGVQCCLVTWDAAAPASSVMTLSLTPSGGQQAIMEYDMVDDSSMPLANRRQILYTNQSGGTLVFGFADSTSAATYYNPYQSHVLGGVHRGYWQDEVVKADSSIVSGAAAQNRINILGAAKAYPRETGRVVWRRSAGSTIFVRPGNTVHLTTDDIDADYEVTAVQVDFPAPNDMSEERVTLTLGPPILKWLEDGSDGVAGPAHEIDIVPPNAPGAPSVLHSVYNPASGRSELQLSYSASTSADVAGYLIVGTVGNERVVADVGTSLTPQFSVPAGVTYSLQNFAYDGATPPNISAAGGTVSGTTASPVFETLMNGDFEGESIVTAQTPYYWDPATANGGTAGLDGVAPNTGRYCVKLSTTGTVGSSAGMASSFTVVRGASYLLQFYGKSSVASTSVTWKYSWYDSNQSLLGTSTGTKTLTTSYARYTATANPVAGAAYYKVTFTNSTLSRDTRVDTVTSVTQVPTDGLEAGAVTPDKTNFTATAGNAVNFNDSNGALAHKVYEGGTVNAAVLHIDADVSGNSQGGIKLTHGNGATSLLLEPTTGNASLAAGTASIAGTFNGGWQITGDTAITGILAGSAAFALSGVSTKTATFTADGAAAIYVCNSASAITANLPAASGLTGRIYTFININSGKVTIDGNGSEAIDGITTYPLQGGRNSVTIVCTGAGWYVLNQGGLILQSDGTRWLGPELVKPFTLRTPAGAGGLAAVVATLADAPVGQTRGVQLVRLDITSYVVTTNNGSNYWTYTLLLDDGTGTRTNVGSANTSAHAANNWKPISISSFSSNNFAAAAQVVYNVDTGFTGSPGNIYPAFDLHFREIYT